MNNIDTKTYKYYEENAAKIFTRYENATNGIEKYFRVSFPNNSKILDIGAGSGRDMNYLLNMGYDVFGIEPSNALRKLALNKHHGLKGRLWSGKLPELPDDITNTFDGVLCSAVLMHIPKENLFDTAFAIRKVLKGNGRLLLSIPSTGPLVDENCRDETGRLFNNYPPDYLQLLFERIGFKLIGKWETNDGLGRKERTWNTMLFQLSNTSIIRPIDQIEGILSRDKKTATYKLALIRALCEISITNYNQITWENDGYVNVPLDLIVEKWIYYYWPLVENSVFLPQIYGEKIDKNNIAFRSSLNELIKHYKKSGGLNSFTLDLKNSSLNAEAKRLFKKVFQDIRKTIIYGPVKYSGGSLETGKVFSYIKDKKSVCFSSQIWQELSLMSHWINDAIILRWAELTSDISRKTIKPSEVIDLLLTIPTSDRDVYDARNYYANLNNLECVWTGKYINSNYDVDHLIPFSLWKNNDLWNLLPSDPSINRKKGDSLPTSTLLNKRKEVIIYYWKYLRSVNKTRFDYEAKKILTRNYKIVNWENSLFTFLKESVETTALQRSVHRWEPLSS